MPNPPEPKFPTTHTVSAGSNVLAPPKPKSPRASSGLQKRTENRLARLVSRGGKTPEGVKPGRRVTVDQAKAIKAALLALNAKNRAEKGTAKPSPFNPLTPLTGPAFDAELAAASRAQFADQERALSNAFTTNQQGQELAGSYFDQYQKALAEATQRIQANNAASIAASKGRVDQAFGEDSAAAAGRTAAASGQASQLGLTAAQTNEGAQAAEAARSQGNQAVIGQRTQADSSNAMMEGRTANALLAKAETLSRAQKRRESLSEDERRLAQAKGDFATNYRSKARESERSWAAVQEEFGLKKAAQAETSANNAANRRLERQKLATQKIVARLYSDASKEKAAATIRVAKLQLEKGKIDQKQYREIINIYKGLPKKGSSTPAKPDSGTKKQSWEVDAEDRAIAGYTADKFGKTDRAAAIAKAVSKGIPKRLAESAWQRYVKSLTTPYDNRNHG